LVWAKSYTRAKNLRRGILAGRAKQTRRTQSGFGQLGTACDAPVGVSHSLGSGGPRHADSQTVIAVN
jgi:hypothetical protein